MSCNSFPLPLARALFHFIDKCLKIHAWWRYFLVQFSLECAPSACLFLLWPPLSLWINFHYNSIIHQKIELSVPLQRWKTLEILSNQALYSHCNKSSPQIYRETQLRDTFLIALSAATHFTFSCFSYHWHIGKAVFSGLLTISFLKSASFRGKGKGDNGQPLHFPSGAVSKLDASRCSPSRCLQLCSGRTNVADWEVLCVEVAGIRLQNEVLLTDPADNGHLGLCSGPLRVFWSSHREHTNREQSGI